MVLKARVLNTCESEIIEKTINLLHDDELKNGSIAVAKRLRFEFLIHKPKAVIVDSGNIGAHIMICLLERDIPVFVCDGISKKVKTGNKIIINSEGRIYYEDDF